MGAGINATSSSLIAYCKSREITSFSIKPSLAEALLPDKTYLISLGVKVDWI